MPDRLTVRFWGVRGSVPVASAAQRRGGGCTPCVELRCGSQVLFFDAGTGLVPAGLEFERQGSLSCDILLSHSHYDHIMGLPFFKPLMNSRAECRVWSGHRHGQMTTAQVVDQFMSPPFFPAKISVYPASVAFCDFAPGDMLALRPGIRVETAALDHPGGVIGYAVHFAGRKVTYATDFEHGGKASDQQLLSLAGDADLLICDGMYADEEFPAKRGFGHSTWQKGVEVAKAARAKRLALFHHSPWQSDDELDIVERAAASRFSNAFAAREGLVLEL